MALKELHRNPERIAQISRWVVDDSQVKGRRTGQTLFNNLPPEIAQKVRATRNHDPFYANLTYEQVYEWYDNHIVFDDEGYMVGLYAGGEWLWTAEDGNG